MEKIGLIVNPIAGIGGKAGLKGSDGEEIYREAILRGSVKERGQKALLAVRALKAAGAQPTILTCPGEMGARVCEAAGLAYTVIEVPGAEVTCPVTDMPETEAGETALTDAGCTTAADTVYAARTFLRMGAALILFAGGDGTARDMLDAVGEAVPVLGIPAGCKIHSGVYALNPRRAGELAAGYLQGKVRKTKEAEVMDIDEEEFRGGRVQSRLYGYLRIPDGRGMVQNKKSGSRYSEQGAIERLADYLADTWDEESLYIVGGGSTTAAVMRRMNLPNTLLGVDLVYKGRVAAADCTEQEILEMLDRYTFAGVKILVTVIGGQGCIFGRGNQQISARVIRRAGRENIIVAASPDKLLSFLGSSLSVDTGDEEVNRYLSGYMRVLTGYGEYTVMKVSD